MAIVESQQTESDEIAYAPISTTAIIAFLMALLSAGCVFFPLLLFLGPMAVAASLAALYILRRQAGALRGSKLAISALLISALFTGWGTARFLSHQWWLYRHAEAYVAEWVRWIEEGQLTRAYTHTAQSGAFNPTSGRASPLEGRKFFENEPFKTIREGKGELVRVTRAGILERGGRTYVVLKYEYRVKDKEGGKTRTVPLQIELLRTYRPNTQRYEWFIADVH